MKIRRAALFVSTSVAVGATVMALLVGCSDAAAPETAAPTTAGAAHRAGAPYHDDAKAVGTARPALPYGRAPHQEVAAKLSFNETIQPILSENCYACHGPDSSSRKASLRLDRAEFAFAPHEKSGPAILPGKPDESPLIARIETTNLKERMPPAEAHKTLTPLEIAQLRRWIAEGAEYQEHWAFIAPVAKPPPAVSAKATPLVRNDVDRFIFARLEKENLTPSPEASRRALIRRVTLDLTGLLPTPAEVDAFVADKRPGAYDLVVSRLLASPRFGEHRARYWLDYVRYADTHGIHFDNYRAIWPYRDYVIRAFNANVPFDRFIREQLAGDLLPARTMDELAATGFMRNNMTTNEGGTVPEEVFVNQTRDRVEAFGATFLGLTTGCAACHDHKFDPFTQRDFYSLAAYLNNTAEKPWDSNIADPGPVLRLPTAETSAAAEVLLARRAELQEQLAARRARAHELIAAWLADGQRPQPVATDGLELRLKGDEGAGDTLHNSAPGAAIATFTADTNPLIWGENSWLWPSLRMDILSRVKLGSVGDVDAGDKFSGGGWVMLRMKPGSSGTGNGALLARMGDTEHHGGAGWEIYQQNGKFVVSLMAPKPAAPAPEPKSETPNPNSPNSETPDPKSKTPEPQHGLSITTRSAYPRDEWTHVFFTYDGSRRHSGLKIYINGKPVATDARLNSLAATDSIRTDATTHLGRRDDFEPMRETRYQDIRFYRRTLTEAEVVRLPFEDVAAEIVARQPDVKQWTTDEDFVVTNRYFLGQVDADAMRLATAITGHTAALDALTKDGDATLIAVEKESPAYADLLKRGDYYARVGRVGPATPHFLPPLPQGAPVNRLGLAEWLLTPEQPLFARVTVNRMWQELFGRGLVETSGDFGITGAKPSHPELLDWLAVEFRTSGWDVKQFYRLLVTSATYRQTAVVTEERLAADPSNRLLSRGPRYRMDGEMLRDSALEASGLLVEKLGGPSVKPYQPAGLWEEVAMPESNTKSYAQDKGDGLYRRSVYTFWKRASMPPSMEAFDATSREVVCTRRARTDTPLQAFVTMNDPQWVEAARKLAERAVRAAPTTPERLDFIASVTLGRPLAPREKELLVGSQTKFHEHFTNDAAAASDILLVGESPADPAIAPAELAEWTMVASQFLNLDEFLTK